jgi:hypothetical protein
LKVFENSTILCLAYLKILEVFKLTGVIVSRQAGGKVVKTLIAGGEKNETLHVPSILR